MRDRWALTAAAVWILATATPVAAQHNAMRLTVQPSARAVTLAPGISSLIHGAFAYRPAAIATGAMPAIVLLHGGGGDAKTFLRQFVQVADRHGAVLVAPQSAGETWDVVIASQRKGAIGADTRRINAVLAELFVKAPVDPRRVVLLGMSDGASYAISLGLGNPQLFRGVVVLSPGFAFAPPRTDPSQKVFIAHGRSDHILPFENVRGHIVPSLERAGSKLRVRWFNGGHEIKPDVVNEGIAFALGDSK